MRIEEVRISDYAEQALELMRQNWAETGFDFDFAPDFETYQQLQDAGLLFALVAFDGAEIVGYSTASVSSILFNPGVIVCNSDALFVEPTRRAGTLPGRLVLATEALARERGASRMLWHTRAGTPFADMLELRGYVPADVIVMREL